MTWTLKQELRSRNLTVDQACALCNMDYHTMCILVTGGVTLPSLALKVARGLRLNQEQAATLGKPLNLDAWGPANGLPRPRAIDVDEDWVSKLHTEESDNVINCRRVWLDIPAITEYMWKTTGKLDRVFGDKNGCRFTDINVILTDWKRLQRIEQIEKQLNIPPEVAEMITNPIGVRYILRFQLEAEKVRKYMQQKEISFGYIISHAHALNPDLTRDSIGQRISSAHRAMNMGEPITIELAKTFCEGLGVDLHEYASPALIKIRRGTRAEKI